MVLFKDIMKWVGIVLGFGIAGYIFLQIGPWWLAFIVWLLGVFVLLIFVAGNISERPRVSLVEIEVEGKKFLWCPECDSKWPKGAIHSCKKDIITDKFKCLKGCRSYSRLLTT